VERRRGGEDVTGDSVGGGWVGEVEAKMRSRKVFTGVVRGARTDARFVVRSGTLEALASSIWPLGKGGTSAA
jgi:hypothetical protein